TSDPSSMVRSVALVGLGELLPFVTDRRLRKRAVDLLLAVLADASAFPELRSSAYEGILAAIDILPGDRPAPGKIQSFPDELDPQHLARFLEQYQGTGN